MSAEIMSEARARLYKTAYFSQLAHDNEKGKLTHKPVRVVFMAVQWNALYKVEEPVFSVYATMDDASFIGHYFARALKDFCI